MRQTLWKKRGQSAIEFSALIILVMFMFIVFQKYIARGFTGRWKGVGDMIGQGRIYDPNKTVECATNVWFAEHQSNPTVWYDQRCFERNCDEHCLHVTRDAAACWTCMTATCQSSYCDP